MSTNLATIQPPRTSLLATMAGKYGMDPENFKQVIKATVMPSNATNEQMAAFLLVAHEYDLNPITKEIYAFPARGGGVTPVVGVDGWINLAQRRPEFDGMEHDWAQDDKGNPVSCTCRIYRKDRGRPVVVTEFMDECKRPTDPWRSHPRRMLRHKATIQAIRYAFGFAGIKDEDDADVIYSGPVVATQTAAPVADLNARLAADAKPAEQPEPSASSEWPKPDANGELLDIRGCPWLDKYHSQNKSCNSDGTWRKARGVPPSLVTEAEEKAMAAIKPTAPVGEDASPFELTGELTDIEKGMAMVRDAKNDEELDGIMDWSRDADLSDGERTRLYCAIDDKRAV